MEDKFGSDFSGVRVHTGEQASQAAKDINATAFTHGHNIYFGAGQYQPGTREGEKLLTHELTHTIQQSDGISMQSSGSISRPSDPTEREADSIAEKLLQDEGTTESEQKKGQPGPSTSAPSSIQRQSIGASDLGAKQQFVDDWFRNHRSVSNKDIQAVPALPEPLREAVMDELRRRYGNEYIRRGMAGTLPEKQPENKEVKLLNAEEYWNKYGAMTLKIALERAMTDIEFDIEGPGLRFPPEQRGEFVRYGFALLMDDTLPDRVSQLLDSPLFELINNARIIDDLGQAPDAYEPAVVERILERLGFGIRRATARLAIPYAKARYRAVTEASSNASVPVTSDFLPHAASDDPNQVQPSPQSFGARTTIEHAVADAMCAGLVEFDKEAFGLLWDTTIPGEPRPVQLELERGLGDWMMVRVVMPAEATAVDVANTLYGDPQFAHLVVGTGDLYSFVFPPTKQLAEPYETMWQDHLADEGAWGIDMLHYRNATDPVLGLDDELADKRALESAAGYVADTHGAEPVLQRLDIMQSLIDDIVDTAQLLQVAAIVQPMQARIAARRQACAADPSEAERWAGHTAGQLGLLSEAKIGFDAITQQLFAMGLGAASTSTGQELVGDMTESVWGSTWELSSAYAGVVAASDQLDIGHERLAIAKEHMAMYPFDMVDHMLAVIRGRIAATNNYATVMMHSYDRARLDALQQEISTTVAQLRMAVVNGDSTATVKLQNLRSQLAMLDLQSTLGSMISAIDALTAQLLASKSLAPDEARAFDIQNEIYAALEPWRELADLYDRAWQAGHEQDPEWINHIRMRVEELRKTTRLPELVNELASYAKDEAERQRWQAIGIMIFGALLAAVTGGLAGGAIGGVAGLVVSAGIESLTFTAITSTLNQDQTFGGFMAEIGLNFVTSLGLGGINRGAKWLAGDRALTIGEKFGEMTLEALWLTASVKAQEEIQRVLTNGGQVTTQSAAQIFGHQMLIVFAQRVAGRGISHIIERAKGIKNLPEVQAALEARNEAAKVADKFLETQNDKLGESLVKRDTAAMHAEAKALDRIRRVGANPVEAARHGITIEPGALDEINKAHRGITREINEREIADLMKQTTSYADHTVADPAVYAKLLEKHRAQGSTVVEDLDKAGQPKAIITPSLADGSTGTPFTLHSRLGNDAEKILADKNLPNTALVSDYLAKRAHDRMGALADLRKVRSAAELDALMEKTLGKKAVAARARVRVTSQPPPGYKVVNIDNYTALPRDTKGNIAPLPEGVVYEFPGGNRVWREGEVIRHESVLGTGPGRQGFELEMFSASETGKAELRGMERAHTLGQGTGFESPFGIFYAPREVNQIIQNNGIEEFLRGLRDNAAPGETFHVATMSIPHARTLRLKEIRYRVEISRNGQKDFMFEYVINVGNDLPKPTVTHEVANITQSSEIAHYFDLVDVPERLRDRIRFARRSRNR